MEHFIIVLLTFIVINFSDASLKPSTPDSICKGVYSAKKYKWNHNFDFLLTTERLLRKNLQYEIVWHSFEKCCPGYNENNSVCQPMCLKPCENGECYKPNECRCHLGYTKNNISESENICYPNCKNDCLNGKCVKPDICQCDRGYKLKADNITCEPHCNILCPKNSYCIDSDKCKCYPSYDMTKDENGTLFCSPICGQKCINSDCIAPDVCQCKDGYFKDEDDTFVCYPKCNNLCLNGYCSKPNVCACYDGDKLSDDGYTCQPVCNETCINGNCTAPNKCTCNEGYKKTNLTNVCEPICEKNCINGHCNGTDICICNKGYLMSNNSKCEPVCTEKCINATCTAPETCTCKEGFRKHDFMDHYCKPKCITSCKNGYCREDQHHCICNEGYDIHKNGECELISCSPECKNGNCVSHDYCSCSYGWTGRSCGVPHKCAAIFDDKFDSFNGTVNNETRIEPKWKGPICNKNCLNFNTTDKHCLPFQFDNTIRMLCLLDLDVECNINSLEASGKNTSSIVWSTSKYVIYVIIGSMILIFMFLIIRRLKGQQGSKKIMKDFIIIFVFIKIFIINLSNASLTRTTWESVCNSEYSTREYKMVPYEETYKQKVFGVFYKIKTRINYRKEYHIVWHTYEKCCPGYFEYDSVCQPVCQKSCENGECHKPNECRCNLGYRKEDFVDNICVPICQNDCIHGTCTKPDICTCDSGYSLESDGFTCVPICETSCPENSSCLDPNRCECDLSYHEKFHENGTKFCAPNCGQECVNGFCFEPDVCNCYVGYFKEQKNSFICNPKCNNPCSYGICTFPDVCTCFEGHKLLDDGFTCQPICKNACINGNCIAPNMCTCFDGYGFTNDSDSICKPICRSTCENGQCIAPETCKCNDGYKMDNYSNCEPVCSDGCHFGTCTTPNNCTCFKGYKKINESVCEPICDKNCDNGRCSAPDICICNEGYRMSNKSMCEPVCTNSCINGKCSAPENCTCNEGFQKSQTLANFCESLCKTNCENGHCTGLNFCTCNDGYKRNEELNTCEPFCKKICENGYCSSPEICTCNEGYQKSNESKCEPVCSEGCKYGECTSPEKCTCLDGYKKMENSTNCEPICDNSCENGHCTSPGNCTCNEDYEKDKNNNCIVKCKCTHGTCREDNGLCICEDGYKLSFENSTICIPICYNACINGECIAPQECKCHDNYIINNDSNNNSTCVSICGVECIHGLCIPEQKACDCYYGWTGRSCEVPSKCAAIFEDALSGEMSDSFNGSMGNVTKIETQWKGPICNKNCLHVDANQTECFNQSLMFDNTTTMLCFLNIDLDCNALSLEDNGIKSGSIVWSKIQYGLYVLIGSIILIVMFLFIRRYKQQQQQESIVVCRSNSFLESDNYLMDEQEDL
ncbi:multiple epidermal growth factor-like domains protein 11 [Leptopilina boulardi]|uniref:multiple epidermal growth factor-like domains protein 11 n=1 Tax=Leptopilina boulardi TaxID=63433 RepID=UPI0021F697F4|nr:multiple epidermal growth factor-like domains protein 11 [Leptopilina boulardi]